MSLKRIFKNIFFSLHFKKKFKRGTPRVFNGEKQLYEKQSHILFHNKMAVSSSHEKIDFSEN